MLMHVSGALVEGVRQAGAGRLIVVAGSAASARRCPASRQPAPPAEYERLALAHAQTRDYFLTVAGLDWIYASPAQFIEPGERADVFQIGGDELLTDADGGSRVTRPLLRGGHRRPARGTRPRTASRSPWPASRQGPAHGTDRT
jgi:putative NADH-flavin reductase